MPTVAQEPQDLFQTCQKRLGGTARLGVGAIANDVGIVQFNNGYFAVLAVMTCLSTVRMPVRDEQIATVTRAVVSQWKREQLLES